MQKKVKQLMLIFLYEIVCFQSLRFRQEKEKITQETQTAEDNTAEGLKESKYNYNSNITCCCQRWVVLINLEEN